ncbi:hypothetical protein L486_07658 [Kwoniella mangroviensis CBS 10435]|uniref:Uncharacterized protein n=1 Tax=Kwoniella mangroviensis CBS 10435 TaxID=1331196 RepID=A0A1B9IHJ1_9TREE|nr:hypothetical protein L486_07658 [Kwoniella mangroviensis CBS 10435]
MKARLATLWGNDTTALHSMAVTLSEEGLASGTLNLNPEEGCLFKIRFVGSLIDPPEVELTFSSIGFCSCGPCGSKTSMNEMSRQGFRVVESKDKADGTGGMIYYGTLHIGSHKCDLACKSQMNEEE